MNKYILFSLVLLFQICIYCQSDSNEFFINLMKTEFEAFRTKDPSLWERYVHEDALFTAENNTFKTKEQLTNEMKNAPDIFLNASEVYDDVIIRIFENTAILSCITTFSFTSSDGNVNSIKFKFTRVHVREGRDWKLVYHSAIPI